MCSFRDLLGKLSTTVDTGKNACFEDMVDHAQFVEAIPEDIRSLVPTEGNRGVLVLDDVVVILGNAAMMIRVLFLNFLTTAT